MPTITVYVRSVYGSNKTYAADPMQAPLLRTLTGTKTLEERHLCALEGLGFTVQQVPDPASALKR